MSDAAKAFEADFDWERLRQLTERDTDFEMELLQVFLEDMERSFMRLASAIATQDINAVKQVTHSIRGAAVNIGAVSLAQTATQLEQLTHHQQLVHADKLLYQLQSQSQVVEQHLQAISAAVG